MPRFFIEQPVSQKAARLSITGDDFHHIRDVLRLQPGTEIIISDGHRTDYTCQISEISSSAVEARVISCQTNQAEPPYEVILYQGLAKGDKMDSIIQKAVELGAAAVVPVVCSRSVVRLKDNDQLKKTKRWQRIAQEAAKQCGRGVIPLVQQPLDFQQAIDALKTKDLAIFPWENERENSLRHLLRQSENTPCFRDSQSSFDSSVYPFSDKIRIPRIGVMIGPEGGFSAQEAEAALLSGIAPVSLGRRILRTETAGPAVLAMLAYQFDQF